MKLIVITTSLNPGSKTRLLAWEAFQLCADFLKVAGAMAASAPSF